jgi:hypothetical protein
MASSTTTPRVLNNDDGWILSRYEPPISIDQLRDNMVGTYAGSPVDTFLWSVGGHEVFEFETNVGERFGEGLDSFDDDRQRNQAENLRHLIEHHGGPVTVISRLCHEAGMKFFPSLRMNEHYEIPIDAPNYGRFRLDHPELLIGRPGEQIPANSLLHGIRTGKDYAFPEVRAFMSQIILELMGRFDCDGVELDFFRHPAHFRPEEAYANRYLITEMIRRLRERMDRIGHEKGRKLEIAARVPATVADSARIGLDAEVWIKEGLVDIVIAGGGFIPFETRIDGFVQAATGTNCQILGCFEALAGLLDTEVLRAIAARYWDQGAQGIYFFNYFNLPNDWKRDVIGELADPRKLARLTKRYKFDTRGPETPTSQLGWSFHNAIRLTQLPVRLERTLADRGAILRFSISDDLDAARADSALEGCTLGMGFNNFLAADVLEIKLNDESISWESKSAPASPWTQARYGGGGYPASLVENPVDVDAIEFDITNAPLRQGENSIEVRLVERDPVAKETLVLKDVRVSINYKN